MCALNDTVYHAYLLKIFCYTIECDFNDMIQNLNAVLKDFYVMLRENEIKGFTVVRYAMLWYTMMF